jgi:flagellar biosynthetic protein FliR
MIQLSVFTVISAFLTIGIRLTGLMLFAPFFGSLVMPTRIKAVLVLALTVLLYPTIGPRIASRPIVSWPLTILIEFFIGVGMGIATNAVFEAVQLAGQVLGVQMGYSLVNILDPQTQVDTTVVALFYQSIVMLLFLRMDVHYWLIRAIGNSYLYLPAGSTHLNGLFSKAVVEIGGQVFGIGVQIAAPVLSATLVADVVLGLLGKASPQLPLMLLGPSVKSLLAFLILAGSLKYLPDIFHRLFLDSVANGEHILRLAR